MSNPPMVDESSSVAPRKESRFRLARLQAESSRWTYSAQGLLAVMRPVLEAVFQRLMVVSNCTPGSAHSQAASAICRNRACAGRVSSTVPSVTAFRFQSSPATTAAMNSSVTRTELLAFWYWTEWLSAPSNPTSNPAASSTRLLRSSRALHQMKSWMSGWPASRITILAARRVLPPLLIVPAEASAPRMKLTGPLAEPPPARDSRDDRIRLRLTPAPDPPLKIVPSSTYQFRMDDIWSSTERMKHADACWGTPATPMLNHTGELNAARWFTIRNFSSSPNVAASASSTK